LSFALVLRKVTSIKAAWRMSDEDFAGGRCFDLWGMGT
jgi:hypothetical protein